MVHDKRVNELLTKVRKQVDTAPYDKLVNELFMNVTRLVDTAPYDKLVYELLRVNPRYALHFFLMVPVWEKLQFRVRSPQNLRNIL